MTATLDLSSLARFDNRGLTNVLADRRDRARRIKALHGNGSVQHRAALAATGRVVSELAGRGVSA